MSAARAIPLDDPRRHDGPALLSLPPKLPVGPSKESTDASEFGARNVLNALRYHLVLFLFLGTLVSAAAAFAAWNLFPAKYTANALLRVYSTEQTVADRNPNSVARTDFGTFLSTQAAMIKSHLILDRALGQSVGNGRTLKQLPMFAGLDDPIAFLEEKITIEFSDKSEIMKVLLIGNDPMQITATVNAVIDAFIKEVETYRREKALLCDALTKAKTERETELENLQKQYDSLYRPKPANEAVAKQKSARMMQWLAKQAEQGRIQNEVAKLRELLASAQVRLNQADKVEKTEAEVPELSAYVNADPYVQKKTADISSIDKYISFYNRTSATPNDDHIQSYRRRLERERSELEELKKQARARAAQMVAQKDVGKPDLSPKLEVLALQRRLEQSLIEERQVKDDLTKFGDVMQDEPVNGTTPEKTLMEIKLTGLQQRVADLNAKAESAKTEQMAGDRVKLYEKAHLPQNKEMKKQLVFTGVGSLAGYFLVGGLITLSEVRKQRVYSHRDPMFARLPLLGRIPEHGFITPANGSEPATDDLNGLAFREAIDRIKTLAIRQMNRRNVHSLLVTSPAMDEGKSILAWNLAAGLARTDYKVLFVDANLRRPTIHQHLNISLPAGLAELLRDEQTMPDVVLPTPVPNLFCMAAGHGDEEARRALDKPSLTSLLDRAKQHFDYVICDAGALTEAVDPMYLAQRVDGVILSLRTFRSRTPAAEQAVRQLQHLGTPLIGVVLTDPTMRVDEA